MGSLEEAFVGLLSGFDIGLAEPEHAIKQAGEFAGPGVEAFAGDIDYAQQNLAHDFLFRLAAFASGAVAERRTIASL